MKVFLRQGLILLCAALCLASPAAWSQDFPTKPIRIILPSGPGGLLDQIVLLVGPKLTEAWGQQVLMDHRPGAGGALGSEIAAKATPDGHTLVLGSFGPFGVSPSLFAKLPYDPVKDFAAITLACTFSNLLVVYPSLPVNSVRELIALAKAKPGQLNYSSTGAGQSAHLSGELLKLMAGIDMVHVPYKGQVPALTDTVSGQVQVSFSNAGTTLPFVKSGRLRALGVTSGKRSALFPDIPAIAESGVPGYEIVTWVGFWAPAATPGGIIAKLNTEIVKALRNPEVRSAFHALGTEPAPMTPAETDAYLKAEIAKWARVVKEANIKVQ